MFAHVTNEFELIKSSTRELARFPRMWVPMLLTWLIYAAISVYLRWGYDWDRSSVRDGCLVVTGAILLLALVFSWAAFVQLEMMRQVETDRTMSLWRAFPVAARNLSVALPIVVIWAFIWFGLSLLESLLRKVRKVASDEQEMSPRRIAETVTGFEEFSLTGAFFHALRKGVRMLAFMIYPAIAWEDHGPLRSIKRGVGIARTRWKHFALGFLMTEAVATLVFLPLGLLFGMTSRMELELPSYVWFAAILYGSIAWSYVMFLEQMYAAQLYLWHLMWESEVRKAEERGEPPPKSLRHIRRPTMLDDIPELLFARTARKRQRRRSRKQ